MKVFISYSWDDDDHKTWVRQFTDELRRNGLDAMLDQYKIGLGTDLIRFMEESVRDADCVLCVCTPAYVERANDREGGVGTETTLITHRFFDKNRDKQFIPVVRRTEAGKPNVPDFMGALAYVDFRDDSKFEASMEELLRHLHQQPRYEEPPVGSTPTFGTSRSAPASPAPPSSSTSSPSTASISDVIESVLTSSASNWRYYDEDNLYVYETNPEVNIRREELDLDRNQFKEAWAKRFPDPSAYRSIHEITFRGSPIEKMFMVAVDGHRMYLPMPKSAHDLTVTRDQFRFGRLINDPEFNPYGDRYESYLDTAEITIA